MSRRRGSPRTVETIVSWIQWQDPRDTSTEPSRGPVPVQTSDIDPHKGLLDVLGYDPATGPARAHHVGVARLHLEGGVAILLDGDPAGHQRSHLEEVRPICTLYLVGSRLGH